MHPDPVRAQRVGDVGDVAEPVGQQARLGRVHVDVVDRDRVDPAGREQPRVRAHPAPGRRAARRPARRSTRPRSRARPGPSPGARPTLSQWSSIRSADAGRCASRWPLAPERRLAEPDDVEQPVQQPGRPDAVTVVVPPVRSRTNPRRPGPREPGSPPSLRPAPTPGRTTRIPRDAPSEPLAGPRHLPVDRVHQRTRATDQRPTGAERAERLVRQPGRVDTLHETPNAAAQASSSTSASVASPSSTRRYCAYVPGASP